MADRAAGPEVDLSEAYAIADFTPGWEAFPPRWEAASRAYRATLAEAGLARLGLAYGPSARQTYYLFLPEGAPKGLSVFVHGGYWKAFDRSSWSYLAEGARARGWAVAQPSYDLCPNVQLPEITLQIAAAVSRAAGEIAGPITLSGHSAGGHLVARMCAPGMLPEAVAARLAHVVPISPLADLRPLLQTSMNADLRLDAASAQSESPALQPVPEVPVTVLVGAHERPALLDQAGWLGAAWGCPTVIAPERHHFDVIDALADPGSDVTGWLTPEG